MHCLGNLTGLSLVFIYSVWWFGEGRKVYLEKHRLLLVEKFFLSFKHFYYIWGGKDEGMWKGDVARGENWALVSACPGVLKVFQEQDKTGFK